MNMTNGDKTMKLSEIFGWEKKAKRTMPLDLNNTAFYVNDFREWNNALTSCDRDIDREALAKTLYDKICHSMSWENVDYATYTMYIEFADHLISTMPTWLKPTERK